MSQDIRRKLEASYRKQQPFSQVRDYYMGELTEALVKRNLPLPADDTHIFNDFLSLFQEASRMNGNYDVSARRHTFLNLVKELTINV